MLNIYLVRHGQTEWNADGNRYCGRTDIPLTDIGIVQAQNVREQLKNITLTAAYSSPLKRALHTARIAAPGVKVITEDRLVEADFGNWEYKSREVFIKEDEETWKNWCDNPMITKAGRTGETGAEIINRVDNFFNSLLKQYEEGNFLVVSHNGVNRLYLAYKLGMNVKDYRKLYIDNGTITMFQLNHLGDLTLVHLNSKL